MIKIENVEVFGWEAAVRGMRNPMNSWDKSDSTFTDVFEDYEFHDYYMKCADIGENDLKLMKSLVKAGSDHSKFMRMINVTCDITAPLYFWKEFDTYKIGTVRNSCSTMHKIAEKEFTLEDFSHEHLTNETLIKLKEVINYLNISRDCFISDRTRKDYWWQMIQLLPSSYNQKATVQLNYAVLRNMYHGRKNHKLDEWREDFCRFIESLPYSELITCGFDDEKKEG